MAPPVDLLNAVVRTTSRLSIALGIAAVGGLVTTGVAVAQEPRPGTAEDEEPPPKRQKIGFYQGTAWIPESRNPSTGEKQTILAPAYGVVYEYWFTHRFAFGTYDDIDLINTAVESEDGELVKRENTVVLSAALVWALAPHWTLSAGPGVELESNESVWLARFGAEYGWELPKDWEISIGASYELKEFYDSWGIGLTIGRRFGMRLPARRPREGQAVER